MQLGKIFSEVKFNLNKTQILIYLLGKSIMIDQAPIEAHVLSSSMINIRAYW